MLNFGNTLDYEIIGPIETDRLSTEFFPSALYSVLYSDRHRCIGGRVLLAFRRNLTVLEFNLSHLRILFPTIDVLGAHFYCESGNLKIIIVYISPDTAVGIYLDFIDGLGVFSVQSKRRIF